MSKKTNPVNKNRLKSNAKCGQIIVQCSHSSISERKKRRHAIDQTWISQIWALSGMCVIASDAESMIIISIVVRVHVHVCLHIHSWKIKISHLNNVPWSVLVVIVRRQHSTYAVSFPSHMHSCVCFNLFHVPTTCAVFLHGRKNCIAIKHDKLYFSFSKWAIYRRLSVLVSKNRSSSTKWKVIMEKWFAFVLPYSE